VWCCERLLGEKTTTSKQSKLVVQLKMNGELKTIEFNLKITQMQHDTTDKFSIWAEMYFVTLLFC